MSLFSLKIIVLLVISLIIFFGGASVQKETPRPPLEPPKKAEIIDQSLNVAATTTAPVSVATKKSTTTATSTKANTGALPILKKEAPIEKKAIIDVDKLNTLVRGSVINIFCTTKTGGDLRPLSGSGIVISKTGIILTNAHIGQYFLLRDYKVKDFLTCLGRTGSPAYPTYKLELVYLPDVWLTENAKKINDENPLSTGENDYAFVVITGSISGNQIPNIDNLPYLEGETRDVFAPKDNVLLAAYPAGFLGGIIIQKDLWLASSISTISKLYYFNDPEKIDLFTIEGNIISQKGASGGAVVSLTTGKLLGIITTATTNAKTTDERELSALTLAYIKSQFEKSSGKTLSSFLEKPTADLIADFDNTLRTSLTEKITKVLDK